MKKYCKPSVVSYNSADGLIPLAAIAGLSAAQAAVVGAAAGLSLASMGGRNYGRTRLNILQHNQREY